MIRATALLLVCLTLMRLPAAIPAKLEVREAHYVMGTILEIAVVAPDRPTGQEWIRDSVELARSLDRTLTTYDERSELVALNRRAGHDPQTVSSHLYRILTLAERLRVETAGAFDVTAGPGPRHRAAGPVLTLRSPDLVEITDSTARIDLGGIGKGYAVAMILERLRRRGVLSALVDFGGSSISALGPPPAEPPWEVGLGRNDAFIGTVRLRNVGISTSATLHRDVDDDAPSQPHIRDPRTGILVVTDRQATVLAADPVAAEAWSTALVVEPELLDHMRSIERLPALLFDGDRMVRTEDFPLQPIAGMRSP